MTEKIRVIWGASKRMADFNCPECGTRNVKWIDKTPTSEADKLTGEISVYCFACESLLAFEPVNKEKEK